MTDNTDVLLARIDERTKNIEKELMVLDRNLSVQTGRLEAELSKVKQDMKENYIDKNQFNPIQRAVLTAMSVIFLGVLSAVLNLVVIPKG